MVTVVRGAAGKCEIAQTVQTQRGARTMAVDPKTHKLYPRAARLGQGPAANPQGPRPRPPVAPDSFEIVVAGQ